MTVLLNDIFMSTHLSISYLIGLIHHLDHHLRYIFVSLPASLYRLACLDALLPILFDSAPSLFLAVLRLLSADQF